MQFLVDTSPAGMERLQDSEIVGGQLCTPLTNYRNWGGLFAIDNGAYSGFDREAWFRCLAKHEPHKDKCRFVTMPDVVGNARRTIELYYMVTQDERTKPYNHCWSLVLQDGIEDLAINWYGVHHLFIGGTDSFKESTACRDVVIAARTLDIPVHLGRVNKYNARFRMFASLGCETADGTGLVKDPTRIREIEASLRGDEKQAKLQFEESA